MKLKDLLLEGPANKKQLADAIEKLKNMKQSEEYDFGGKKKETPVLWQAVSIAILNRERTNHDGAWQAEYFYGDKESLSKEQSKLVVRAHIQLLYILEKIMKVSITRIDDNTLVDYVLGGEDPKKYFKDMK